MSPKDAAPVDSKEAVARSTEAWFSEATSSEATPLFSFGPWLWATLGVLLAMLAALTGLGLVFFYQPAAGVASLVDLEQATGFGFLRDLHYWAGSGLLIAAWLHMARVFTAGSYRRRLGWRATVGLVTLVTFQAWLGLQLARPLTAPPLDDSRLAIYAAHILLVPLALLALLALWKGRRSAAPAAAPVPATRPEEDLEYEASGFENDGGAGDDDVGDEDEGDVGDESDPGNENDAGAGDGEAREHMR